MLLILQFNISSNYVNYFDFESFETFIFQFRIRRSHWHCTTWFPAGNAPWGRRCTQKGNCIKYCHHPPGEDHTSYLAADIFLGAKFFMWCNCIKFCHSPHGDDGDFVIRVLMGTVKKKDFKKEPCSVHFDRRSRSKDFLLEEELILVELGWWPP